MLGTAKGREGSWLGLEGEASCNGLGVIVGGSMLKRTASPKSFLEMTSDGRPVI